jgi:shikimate dehydrogenase
MDRYAVVGNPIAHSKSPVIHGLFAEQTAQALTYDKLLVELTAFEEEVTGFFALGGKGLNVTVPFKEQAYRYADTLSERARLAGAVNTLSLQTDGTVCGDNTDGVGLVADLLAQGWTLSGRRVLILGAGGAVRGIVGPLLEQNPESLVIANRTVEKAAAIAQAFPQVAIGVSAYEDLHGDFDLVINGTSASLGGELPPLPSGILGANSATYDLMYGAEPTAFLRFAQEQGAKQRSDGLGMLVEQAAEAFYLWRGVRPETAPVIARLRQMIGAA